MTKPAKLSARLYRLDPRALGERRSWLARHWAEALEAFARFAKREKEDK